MPIPKPLPILQIVDFLKIPISPFRSWALSLEELGKLHFPDNIFAHYDLLISQFWQQGAKNEKVLMTYCQKVNSLYESFGVQSCVKFRYEHDFLYGFDWAKWVKAKPFLRNGVAPFSFEFMDYLEQRALELHELIAVDDQKYYRDLAPGTHRNPFGFSREPEEERTLMERLFASDLLPVKAWDLAFKPDFSKDYVSERKKMAIELQKIK